MIPACFGGLLARMGLLGIVEAIVEEFKSRFSMRDSLFLYCSDAGEGSSNPNKSGGTGRIGLGDFSFDSDSDSNSNKVPRRVDQPSQEMGDNTNVFKDKVNKMNTKEEVDTTKQSISLALNEYQFSGTKVPAYEQEVKNLKDKLDICENKLLELEKESKNKGKEVVYDTIKKNTSTDAATAVKKGSNPEFASSSRYQIPDSPGSDSDMYDDYMYDSEEEQRAIERAIEESKKTK